MSETKTTYGAWLPIATAPKDTSILLYDGCDMFVAWWDEDEKGWVYACVVTDFNYYKEVDGPTHWMPLPEVPTL